MPYFPAIRAARPRRQYRFGGFEAVLLDRVESGHRFIEYHFILLVRTLPAGDVRLAVASEFGSDETRENPFLGVFPGEGHENLGRSIDWRTLERFEARALRIAFERLGLRSDVPIQVCEANVRAT